MGVWVYSQVGGPACHMSEDQTSSGFLAVHPEPSCPVYTSCQELCRGVDLSVFVIILVDLLGVSFLLFDTIFLFYCAGLFACFETLYILSTGFYRLPPLSTAITVSLSSSWVTR